MQEDDGFNVDALLSYAWYFFSRSIRYMHDMIDINTIHQMNLDKGSPVRRR